MPKYISPANLEKFYNNISDRPVNAFDTVADMQAAEYLEDGVTCHTNGFHTAGDGGAAYYVVGTTGTANGMDVLALQGGLKATLVMDDCVTPRQFGAYGDGTHDDATSLQRCLDAGKTMELGTGIFLTSSPLTFTHSIVGVSAPRLGGTLVDSVIKASFNTPTSYVLNYNASTADIGVCVSNITIDCSSSASGLDYKPQSNRPPIRIEGVCVLNHARIGINIEPVGYASRCAVMSNIYVTGGAEDAECCININNNASDCSITDFILAYCRKGIVTRGGGIRLMQGHIYVGRAGIEDLDTYYNNSIGIESYADLEASNVYIDSAQQSLVQRGGVANISNLFVYNDSFPNEATTKNSTLIRTSAATAYIYIGVLSVGGIRTNFGAISAGNVVINSLVCKWDALPTVENGLSYGQLPFMVENLGRQEYTLQTTQNTYTLAAVVYCGSNGIASVQIGRTTLSAIVDVISNNGTITVSRHKLHDFGDLPVYYAIVDKYVYLWVYVYENVSVKSLHSTQASQTRVSSVCGVNLASMASMEIQTQSTTDGLTLIPLT